MLKLQLERDESEETVAHYTIGSGLEAMRRATSSFYHYNHLGTALALTGADEAVTDTYRHDAWGVLLERTGSTVNPHTYVGRERYYRMPNAAMYHLGFRDYAQGAGRFTTVDPARDVFGWSAYAKNRPPAAIDALGLLSSPGHCRRRQEVLDELADQVRDCPTGDLCSRLNDRLYSYLHDCHGFSSGPVFGTQPAYPPPPPFRCEFGHLDAYSVWLEDCHSLPAPSPPSSLPGQQPWPIRIPPGAEDPISLWPPPQMSVDEFCEHPVWEYPPDPGDWLAPGVPLPVPPQEPPFCEGLPGPPPGSDWEWPPEGDESWSRWQKFWRWFCAPRKRMF